MRPHCFYCNLFPGDTIDHIVPKSIGKHVDRPWNKVFACGYCNFKKGNIPLVRWFENLETHPDRFGHEPRRQNILRRKTMILHHLWARPELTRYPGHVGLVEVADGH